MRPSSSACCIERSQACRASRTSDPLAGMSGLHVPQTAGRPGDQRLDVERRHVLVVGMAEIDASHLRGVVIIPAVVLFRRHGMGLLNPPGDGLDQLVLEFGCACGKGARFGDVVAAELGAGVGFLLAVLAPGEVVERARPRRRCPNAP